MKNWITVTLGDVVERGSAGLRRGPFGGAIKKEMFVAEGYKVYEQKHAIYGDFGAGGYFISPAKFQEMQAFAIQPDDLLISCSGTMGRIAIVPRNASPGIINQALMRIRPDQQKMLPVFLKRLLETPEVQNDLFGSASGSAMKNVKPLEEIRGSKFRIPSLSEQKRIAGILDQADGLRRKRQQALALTDQFLRSTFLDLFGDHVEGIESWDRCFLSDVLFFQEGPGVRKWQFTESGVKLLNVGNIVDGELVLDNTVRHVSELEAFGKYKHFLAEPGDLVMATSGVTWGKTAWVAENHLPLCMNTSTVRFRTLDENRVSRVYMHAFLGSDPFTRQIDKLVTGSAQPNFGPSHLKQVEIVVPPIERQLRYGKIVARLNQTVSSVKQAVSECDALFNSLVQRAFRGDL